MAIMKLPASGAAAVWLFRIAILAVPALTLSLLVYPRESVIVWLALTQKPATPCTAMTAWRGLRMKLDVARSYQQCRSGARLVRRDGDYALWDIPHGQFWILAGEEGPLCAMAGQQMAAYYGDVPADGVVLDIGAHVGLFVRTALNAGARTVVAVEPAPDNLECLRRNFPAEIAAGRVVVVPKGAWDKDATLKLHRVKGNSGGDSVVLEIGPGDTVDVPLTTIDAIVSELKPPRVDMVKLDIKGAERQAIAGSKETLKRWRPRLAMAAEHLSDDNIVLPQLVRGIAPLYSVRCGACFDMGALKPELLLFE